MRRMPNIEMSVYEAVQQVEGLIKLYEIHDAVFEEKEIVALHTLVEFVKKKMQGGEC